MILRTICIFCLLAGSVFSAPKVLLIGDDLLLSSTVSAEAQVTGLLIPELEKRNVELINLSEKGLRLNKVNKITDTLGQTYSESDVAVIVIILGHNDIDHLLSASSGANALNSAFETLKDVFPNTPVILGGFKVRNPSANDQYIKNYEAIYFSAAVDHKANLIPNVLQSIEGDATMISEKGVLTESGHLMLAKNIWRVLRTKLPQPASSTPVKTEPVKPQTKSEPAS
jgi:hypothetical protein